MHLFRIIFKYITKISTIHQIYNSPYLEISNMLFEKQIDHLIVTIVVGWVDVCGAVNSSVETEKKNIKNRLIIQPIAKIYYFKTMKITQNGHQRYIVQILLNRQVQRGNILP